MTVPMSKVMSLRLADGTLATAVVQNSPMQAVLLDEACADPGNAIVKWWYGEEDDEPKEDE